MINVLRRPDGGAVVGTGSHSGEKMELVQLRRQGEGELSWRFEGEERVGLVGAHGEEIVRSFCFLDKVCVAVHAVFDIIRLLTG